MAQGQATPLRMGFDKLSLSGVWEWVGGVATVVARRSQIAHQTAENGGKWSFEPYSAGAP